MFVGIARLVIQIPGARTLKDRRRVVKSFKDRVRARLPVSVAEVGDLERYQVATLGIATVSGDAARCSEVLSRVHAAASTLSDAVLADVATEVIPFGVGGSSIRGGIEQSLNRFDAGRFSDEFEDDDEDD
jgi:uncharacterized protein YlxP (DUF503 family)